MRRLLFATTLLTIASATALFAADFWEKDFQQWTDKEVLKMLANSPWASEFSQRIPGTGPGPGREGARGPGGGSGASVQGAAPPPEETFTITWRTATPIKQALARAMSGTDPLTPQLQAFVDQEADHYLVTVSGLKRRFGVVSEDPEELMNLAALEIKGKGVIKPRRAEARSDQSSTTIFYEFPKTEPITLDDKDVEFIFEMARTALPRPGAGNGGGGRGPGVVPPGGTSENPNMRAGSGGGGPRTQASTKMKALEIRRKFRLKEMVYDGKLDL